MKICIDAGHNYSGYNTGAQGCGLKEQNITWDISERLRIRLEKCSEVKVIMTRWTKETNLGQSNSTSLSARYKVANDNNCDLFVSIHCNSADDSSANGVETLIYERGGVSEAVAEIVQEKITSKLGLRNRGVKQRPELAVLKHTKMPAILIETGFITNPSEANKLLNNQEDYAEAICSAICDYYGLSYPTETVKEKAARIINSRCDTPQTWIDKLETIPYFADFVVKIHG